MTVSQLAFSSEDAILTSEIPPCFYTCSWVWQLTAGKWRLKHPSRMCPDHGYLAENALHTIKRKQS